MKNIDKCEENRWYKQRILKLVNKMDNTKFLRTPGVKDGFFCLVPDQEHEGYYRPYLFVILDGTKTLEEVAELLKDTLEEHEYPVEIREITERPYFHFKTDRKGLTAQILKELEQAKEEK